MYSITDVGATCPITGTGVAQGTPGTSVISSTEYPRFAPESAQEDVCEVTLDTFHNLLLDLKDRHVNNLFSGVLLHTLKTLLLCSDLSLLDLVVHGRRRVVRKEKNLPQS